MFRAIPAGGFRSAVILSVVALVTTATAHDPNDIVRSAYAPTKRMSSVPCENGRAGQFPCRNLDLLAFIPKSEFGIELTAIGGMSETWGWFDEETGDEYVIQGVSNGVHFVRVNDPQNPEYLGILPNTAGAQLVWYDMKVNDDYLYLVSESAPHNVRAFNLNRLRVAEAGQNVFVEDGRHALNVSAHNIVINDDSDFAYVVGGNIGLFVPDSCSGGLIALDLSVPHLPTEAGCWSGDRYIHDAQCIIYNGPDSEHVGKEICLNSNEDSFSVVDFTDKSNPVRLGLMTYDMTGYTHQGWISEDHRTFFLGDETDEQDFGFNTRTMILDLEDLDDPRLIADHFHQTTSIDHNMYVKDGLLYQSNYTAGLRVLDTAQARSGVLTEVAYFDVYPDNDNASFSGTWGNYPYLPSGTLAVSSMDEGLFLLRLNPNASAPADDAADEGTKSTTAGAARQGGSGAPALLLLIVLAGLVGRMLRRG